MSIDETDVQAGLSTLADQTAATTAPVTTLLARGRRRRALRRAGIGGLSVAVIGVAAAVTALAVPTGPANTPPPVAARPVALSLAAQTTAASTFHFGLTVTDVNGATVLHWQGEADPAAHANRITDLGGVKFGEQRRLGEHCYSQGPGAGTWSTVPCPDGGSLGTSTSLTADPTAVLDDLKTAGTATYTGRTGTGSSTVDSWAFTVVHAPVDGSAGWTESGTAAVDVASGQVTAVTVHFGPTGGSGDAVATETLAYTFTNFGDPVTIEAPPVS